MVAVVKVATLSLKKLVPVISETSCEARNVSLDRALLVDTVGVTGASFFG
jgi:hypothetical protein